MRINQADTMKSVDPNPMPLDPRAFADGELDAQRALDLFARESDPAAMKARVAHQQALREAVGRVMDQPTCPAKLRVAVMGVAQEKQPESPAVIGRIGFTRWLPAAVAALLLVSTLAVYQFSSPTSPPATDQTLTTAGILPAAQVERFAKRHVSCTRLMAKLHRVDDFPQDVKALPGVVEHEVGSAVPSLDLSSLGYRFDRAGMCNLPGSGSAHLIYIADSGDRGDAISLWLRHYTGSPAIDADTLYHVTSTDVAHPMLIWRDANTIYYLVGDGGDAVDQVADYLRNEMK